MHKRAVHPPKESYSHITFQCPTLDSIKNYLNYLISNRTLTASDLQSAMYLGLAKIYHLPIREANLIITITNLYIHRTRTSKLKHTRDAYITFLNFYHTPLLYSMLFPNLINNVPKSKYFKTATSHFINNNIYVMYSKQICV